MTGKTSVISSDIDIREPKNLNIDLVKTFAPTLLKANEKEWWLCISRHNKNIDNKIKSEVYLTKIGINDLLAKYL